MNILLFFCFLLAQIDKDGSCEDEYGSESDNPSDGSRPSYTVEVEEEIGEPLVTGDVVSHEYKGYI